MPELQPDQQAPKTDRSRWLSPGNFLALLALLTAPAMLSIYKSCSTTKTVNEALLIVATGVENFNPSSAWTDSESIKGWRESKKRVRFPSPVPCNQPDVRVSLSSVDLGGATRLDIAAPDEERTRDGFLLVVRTWGGTSEIPWVKVDWFAACRNVKIQASPNPSESTGK
jgi:hypothetical protein